MAAVKAAGSAGAVQNLLTEARFKQIGYGDLWDMYSGLSSAGKTAAATTIYNGSTNYEEVDNFTFVVSGAIQAQYYAEASLQVKPSMDAILNTTTPTLAQINTFLAKVAELGAPLLTATSGQLSAIQSALTAAKAEAENPIKLYLDGGKTAELAGNAMSVVYMTIATVIVPEPED
jgi:hypothetical protein